MTTGTETTTTLTDAALLRLTWLASPALPVGGFSYSEGLEPAVEAGLVHDEQSAGDWLVHQLQLTLARGDLAVVAAVARAPERAAELDTWVRCTRETGELRLQSEQMGKSLSGSPLTYPVAFALAAQATGAPLRAILLAYAFGWSENLVQAAVRAVPLGQSAGQRILGRLADAIPNAVDHAQDLGDETRQAFSPMLAILSARHESQYSRLFRS